jgi:FAD:protein FMN transferase
LITAAPAVETFSVFGTTATLLLTEPGRLVAARSIADAELAAVDLACSRFRADSELSAVNAAGGRTARVSWLFAEILGAALRAAELTGGDVDPTCGRALVDIGYDRDFALLRPAGVGDSGPASAARVARGATTQGAQSATAQDTRPAAAVPAASAAVPVPGPVAVPVPGAAAVPVPGAAAVPVPGAAAVPVPGAAAAACAVGRRGVPGWRNVQLNRRRLRVRLGSGAQLDLGATAKAWAADRCAALIAAQTEAGVLVSLGGDIAVAGPPPPGGWRVRVTDDHAAGPDEPGQTVAIRSGGLATSSTTVRAWDVAGQRMHHIVDPATGRSARSCWRTVSVAAGSCVDANTASTAAIIRSRAAAPWLRAAGLPARLVAEDGSVETTAGWPSDQAMLEVIGDPGRGEAR